MPASPNAAARPHLVLVAALARESRVIGCGLELPWHLPADLRHFKRLTDGGILVMGRRTFESLVHQMGGPLPRRRHVVVTRNAAWTHPGAEAVGSLDDAFAALGDAPEVFIAGGGEVYAQTLTRCDRWELTLVEGDHAGDVVFPPFEHLVAADGGGAPESGPVRFVETRREAHAAADGRPAFAFVTYERRGGEASGDALEA